MIGSALPLAVSFILLPYYTLFATKLFGSLAIYTSFGLLMQSVANWGIGYCLSVYYYEYKDDPKVLKQFVGSSLHALTMIGLGLLFVFYVSGDFLFTLFIRRGDIHFFPYGYASLVTGISMSIFRTYSALLIFQQRPLFFLTINVLNLVLTVGATIIGMHYYPDTLSGPVYGKATGSMLSMCIALYYFLTEYGYSFDFGFFKRYARFCFPVFFNEVFLWSFSYIDRYILTNLLPQNFVGIYDFTAKISQVEDVIVMGIGNALSPVTYEAFRKWGFEGSQEHNSRYFHSYSAVCLLLMPPIMIALKLFLPWFVKNPEYYSSSALLPIMMCNSAFTALVTMHLLAIYFYKKTEVLSKAYLFSSIIFVLIDIPLIKWLGLRGACLALILSKPLQILAMHYLLKGQLQLVYNKYKMIVIPAISIAILTIASIFMEQSFWWVLVPTVLIYAMVFVVYRDNLIALWQLLYNKLTGGKQLQ
jgi:O-antigen/teichoic acid export membrane protein